jgi:hypothetical protein
MATVTPGYTFSSNEVVTPAKLTNLAANATVTNIVAADISNDAITTEKIADANVTTAKIVDNAVTTAKIVDASVNDAKLANGAVTGAAGGGKLAASAITSQTALDALANADTLLIHDDSSTALRKVTWSQIVAAAQPVGSVLQTVNTRTADRSDLTNPIPLDDTIPQNTEGTEIMSASITPASTQNKILVRVQIQGTSTGSALVACLFRDNAANAITAAHNYGGNGLSYGISFEYLDSPSTTSPIIYKVRVGPSGSGTMYLNKFNFGTLVFGAGTVISNITLQEIKG